MTYFRIFLLLCFIQSCVGHGVVLEHIGTIYIPYSYEPDTFEYDEGVAEQIAVEKERPILYAVGNNLIHVVNFSDPENPELVAHRQVIPSGDGSLEDITFCKDWVAVCTDSSTNPLSSTVFVYEKFDSNSPSVMELVHEIEVSSLPDSAKFTSDCSKLIIAVEGEVRNVGGAVVDPEGGVMVVDFGAQGPDAANDPRKTFVDFTYFNNQVIDYAELGVRKTYNGQGTGDIASTTFSQDMEPENIALSADDSKAYIPLQENNAMAVLDLTSLTWVDLFPLGSKSFAEGSRFRSKLDASDRDDEINIRHWPVQALFQPDGVIAFEWEGHTYLVTANEGDDREYEADDLGLDEDWVESERGDDIVQYLSDSVGQEVRNMLMDDSQLGRLKFSLYDGLDQQGKIENLTTFGGRSVSIFRADDMSLVYDTGARLAEEFVELYPFVFNGDCGDADETPRESRDSRSDNRGLEPECLEIGEFNDHVLIFAGLERPGSIAVFSVHEQSQYDSSPLIKLESIYFGADDSSTTWGEMYVQRKAHVLEVEDLVFIPSERSPTESPMLVAAGSVSGTVSFFHVTIADNGGHDGSGSDENGGWSPNLAINTILLSCAVTLVSLLLRN